MLYRLSNHFQKEISLIILTVLMASGLGSLKAQLLLWDFNTSNSIRSDIYSKKISFGQSSQLKDRMNNSDFQFISKQPENCGNIVDNNSIKLDRVNIGGPSQPEMSAFKSVGSDNMVSPFTGDFSYNIPLLDVGGYPVNMFYNSGITMDQEASWVGLGWNLNPGTVTRNMRGLPDDFNGTDEVVKTQTFRADKTFGLTRSASAKFGGMCIIRPEVSNGLSWNNKLGMASELGINAALSISSKMGSSKTYKLTTSAALNFSSRGGGSFSPSIRISRESQAGETGGLNASIGAGYNYSSRMGITAMHLNMNVAEPYTTIGDNGKPDYEENNLGVISGTLTYAYPSFVPSINKPLTHHNFSIDFSAGSEIVGFNPHAKIHGYFSKVYIADEDKITKHSAYGVLNFEKAEGNNQALLDFNRANDGVYTPNSPAIAMPIYTYDVFTINGEGTGGSFRAYRGDVGHMRDATVKSKENAFGMGADLGFGNTLHVGADLSYVYSPTEVGDWGTNNATDSAFLFKNTVNAYQSVYFKNPSEKTMPDQNFQSAMGNEDLIRFKLDNIESSDPILLPKFIRYDTLNNALGEKEVTNQSTQKTNRDKRTQIISFLTAEESEDIGMNKKIYSYNSDGLLENHIIYSASCNKKGIDSFYRNHDISHNSTLGNSTPIYLGDERDVFRRGHHISELNVLGSDGKKHVFGIPVYNKKQLNVTFNIDSHQKRSASKAEYDDGDNSIDNEKGREWFMEKEEIPPYVHSFLLTELLSSNYVDVTGDGISEDDIGDAVKFNYSKFNDYKWRTPIGKQAASYSEGLKTDEKDDKAHYVYGERESWYLYSIESKNMVARFFVKGDRKDGLPVLDENGEPDMTASNRMKRLDKISLYSKGDLVKYGDNAKPIKTIKFFQSYKLCKNIVSNNALMSNSELNQGKLTLDSIWIMYNGNTRKPKNKYVFYYPADNNPNYGYDQSDRWGIYKPNTDNPYSLLNQDYPYSLQEKIKADKNASAWTMNKIQLPSGGFITIDYESDSYAYVQNRKADMMCQILGFGNSESSLPGELDKLYANDGTENQYVYVKLPYEINSTGLNGKKEFEARYLGDVKQLYLKLAVVMPVGSGLSGISGVELIPVYADIEDQNYGLLSPSVAWIKIRGNGTAHTTMITTAFQFLTRQLPGKAFKGYDLSENGGLKSVVMAMGGMLNSIGALFKGEFNKLKSDMKCQVISLNQSFVRLSDPTRNKLGGGLRVKKIQVYDNWDKMTRQLKSVYGQEYKYETTESINGKEEVISSGVASWEPSIGGDENPFKEIMRYTDHNKAGPFDFGAIEMPLGESFYPSPSVGYSKVVTLSIHRDTVKNPPVKQVTEFYTNKEFPYKTYCTDLKGDANSRYEPSKILQILKIDIMKGIAQSQGFLVETNDMNGKEKSKAIYSYSDSTKPISSVRNFYNTKKISNDKYVFNHLMPVVSSAEGKIDSVIIGRDIEVMTDFRQHNSETTTSDLSINFDGFIVGFLPIPLTTLLQPITKEGTMYRSASILKLVTHYGVLDSVVVIDKGSMVSTKNLLYDAETGNPLLTRTQNEHNKPIYNFNYPAHWAYSGMGSAYKNIDATFSGLEFRHGILTNPPTGFFDLLESGDEMYVVAKNNLSLQPQLPCDGAINKNNPWDTLARSNTCHIWAVNTSKAGNSPGGWVFMDAQGNPFNAAKLGDNDATVRIIRSGKRNMIDQSVGSITSLNNPIVNGRLAFNASTEITQAVAATFKDNWRVDNSFFKVKESVEDIKYARVHRAVLSASSFANISRDEYLRESDPEKRNVKTIRLGDAMYLYNATWGRDNPKGNCQFHSTKKHNVVGFLLYDYAAVSQPLQYPYKALLSLESHTNRNYPIPFYPKAAHFMNAINNNDCFGGNPMHGTGISQNANSVLGVIQGLKENWYSTVKSPNENLYDPNAAPWVDKYFDNNAYLTNGKGIIPYSITGWDDYTGNNKVNVTLPLFGSLGSPLATQNKLGLSLRLDNFNYTPQKKEAKKVNYRCFWSPLANDSCFNTKGSLSNSLLPTTYTPIDNPCPFGVPKLYYYYYKWGNVEYQENYDNDPSLNVLLSNKIRTIIATYCKSRFSRKAMNPYAEGVLGDWRIDTTYIYYGNRKEINPENGQIDTRVAGTIDNFKSFWNLASSNSQHPTLLSRNTQPTDVWVWNSTITQYNRKGYEIENLDALGRYNSGLYGYNQQLPIAVANNSRLRELLYDGFEDYDYATSENCINCAPHRYFNYTTVINSNIDNEQKHSGRYSLRVNTGQNISFEAPVSNIIDANKTYGIKIQNSNYSYTNQALGVNGINGTGLLASWQNHLSSNGNIPLEAPPLSIMAPIYSNISGDIKINQNPPSLVPGISPQYFSVKWEGKIQAPATGIYRFKPAMLDDGYRLKISGTQLSSSIQWTNGYGHTDESAEIPMVVGQVYTIEICYYNWTGNHQFELLWKRPDQYSFSTIPTKYLYPPSANSFQQVISAQQTCYRLDSSQVTGNALTDTFSLLQGSKMVLSAWVKVGRAKCCFGETYNNGSNSIQIAFNDANGNTNASQNFFPSGSIIEGWQRYESVFDVPTNAIKMTVSLKNTNSTDSVYFDDLRIHPYNANIKSYVYHSSNLKLMAEQDENNYSTFYEYDDDGTLIRVKKETQLGVKTITETRSATSKINMN